MFVTMSLYAQEKNALAMQWNNAAKLPAERGQEKALGFAGPVAGVHENVMIIAGGANFPESMPWQNGQKKYYRELYVYEKKGAQIIKSRKKFKLPSTLAYAASCSTLKGIVYAGGENENGISKYVFLVKWDKRISDIIIEKLPDLPLGITNAAATANKNIVYIAGGETSVTMSDQFFCIDLNDIKGGWKNLPPLPSPLSHFVLVSQSIHQQNYVYLLGGRKKNPSGISDFYSLVYAFNISTNKWEQKNSMPYTLCAGTGIAEGKNRILLFGGDRSETFHQVELLLVEIAKEKDEIKKQHLIAQKNKLQLMHPGFSKEILMYNTESDNWEVLGELPFETPVTTVAFKWNEDVIVPSGEIKAGIRTPDILRGKLYFSNK